MQRVKDIRDKFAELYKNEDFVVDKNGGKVIELIGESFLVDEESIFGEQNYEYIKRELEWYNSQSLNVKDIPGKTPKIWEQVATIDGSINSNYGWMIFSAENNSQYDNVLQELTNKPDSRRATMIYQRPTMWNEYNQHGMSDFVCTYGTQHFIRNNELITYVLMRSNDVVFGYRNDVAWHVHVIDKLANDLVKNGIEIEKIKIIWTSGSLHVYEAQFYLVDHYIKTGETHITKKEYDRIYK